MMQTGPGTLCRGLFFMGMFLFRSLLKTEK